MSLYGAKFKIDGCPCGVIMRGGRSGQYMIIFEREYASLEQIEEINWSAPTIEGETILPPGYSFTCEGINYDMGTKSYTVIIETDEEHFGDVMWYRTQAADMQATIDEQNVTIQERDATIQSQTQAIQSKDETIATQEATIEQLESEGSAVELKGDLTDAYTRGVESNG